MTELELLDEEDIDQAKYFLQALIQSKKEVARIENASALKAESIIKLLSNKSNYVSEELIAQTNKMLSGITRYIETFQVVNVHSNGME